MNTVPQTILSQLGGQKFVAMTGARDMVGDHTALTFNLPRPHRFASKVRITLTGADLYTVATYRWSKTEFSFVQVARHDYVDASSLRPVFTALTGLITKL